MKKLFYLFMAALTIVSCTDDKVVNVTVSNGTGIDRNDEIVEISMEEVASKLQMDDTADIIVLDETNQQVPYQTTYDGKLIFPISVKANQQANYSIKVGTPVAFDVRACGKHYPERVDDIAWENDRIAFRAYGPALQATGEKAYGYDVWVKSVEEPVVEERYAMELNPETLAKIDSLKKVDPEAAKALRAETSYHVDHGNGLDCYKVGPTLGGGTAALYVNNEIIYPYCYKTYDILDNGPLRFTVKLTYNPLTVNNNPNIVETRVISLDKGSQLNKAVITYSNTNEVIPVVTGIVLHEPNGGQNAANAEKGYIAYADPTDNVNNNNGTIYVGAVFPSKVKEAKVALFPEKEAKERGGDGHVLAVSDYAPNSEYVYYFGAGWSKYGFESMQAWNNYLENYAEKVRNPLTVEVK